MFNVFNPSIEIFGLSIAWYAVFIITGLGLGVYFAIVEGRKIGVKKDDIYLGLLIILPIAIICTRLWYVIFNFDDFFGDDGSGFLGVLGFEQINDVADLLGDVGGRARLQLLVNLAFQKSFIGQNAVHVEEGVLGEHQRMTDEKLLAENGFVDGIAVEPCGPALRRQARIRLCSLLAHGCIPLKSFPSG